MGRGSAAQKVVQNGAALRHNPHEVLQQGQRFAGDMHLGRRVDRILENARKTVPRMSVRLALAPVDQKFRSPIMGRALGFCQTTTPRHSQPAAWMASVRLGNCRQSVNTSSGEPSRATRQHSESHKVAQYVKERWSRPFWSFSPSFMPAR